MKFLVIFICCLYKPGKKVNLSSFCDNGKIESKYKLDGYTSHIGVVKQLGSQHDDANHADSLRNSDSHTINTIEGLWSQLNTI